MKVALPFSRRTTAAFAVFSCIFIAAPQQGAPLFAPAPIVLAALSLEYAQLVSIYNLFLPGPQFLSINPAFILLPFNTYTESLSADPQAAFAANVAAAIMVVKNLIATLNAITVTGDAAITLQGMKVVAANALTNLMNVQNDE